MQAQDFALDEQHLRGVVAAVAAVDARDGLELDTDDVAVEAIRDEHEYSGLRVTVPAKIWTYDFKIKLDVSTGDPILPAAETIQLPTILDDAPITMLGHPMPMVVAEKTVTILQRGTTSTRWRDLVDVRSLARKYPFTAGELAAAAAAVAGHREVQLAPIGPQVAGYGTVGQAKWSAWLRTRDMAEVAHPSIDDQVAEIAAFVDPVYSGVLGARARWDPRAYLWAVAES